MTLPEEVTYLLDKGMKMMYRHPNHQLIRKHRHPILQTLGTVNPAVVQWLAIITASRVVPVYEAKWQQLIIKEVQRKSNVDDLDLRFIIRSVANSKLSVLENLYYLSPRTREAYARRMLEIAEDCLNGSLIDDYAADAYNGYYYEVMSWDIQHEPKDALYAWWAAY
jgi:hypothetical protein